ncbi:MAG: hypothetical protein K8T20_10500, partial [Planctomycetes bacterium]|nr:hypothetical protein [Planctomycetota bacterium]
AWVNGELVEKRDVWHGVLPDDDRFGIRLKAGWNRVLVKIRNGDGGMGFVGRITDRNGHAIDGLELSNEAKETPMATGRKPSKVDPIFHDDFNAQGAERRYIVPCGGWKVTNKAMWGTDDKRNMQWMKFLVTPGKDKDAPAQCAWIKDTTFKGCKDLAVELKLALGSDGRPKFSVMLDGEGLNDGLSGTSIIFHPNDEGCKVEVWRYDHVVYTNQQVTFPAAKEHNLRIVRYKDRLTVTFNNQPVFDDISMPAISKSNFVGIMTWNKAVGLDDLTIYRLEGK